MPCKQPPTYIPQTGHTPDDFQDRNGTPDNQGCCDIQLTAHEKEGWIWHTTAMMTRAPEAHELWHTSTLVTAAEDIHTLPRTEDAYQLALQPATYLLQSRSSPRPPYRKKVMYQPRSRQTHPRSRSIVSANRIPVSARERSQSLQHIGNGT